MPDIDIDFCIERRQEVIDYVGRKYGKDHVAQIVTFGTLKARGVLRDVGRVLDMPYAQVDAIAKTIPKELNITIDRALKESKELYRIYMRVMNRLNILLICHEDLKGFHVMLQCMRPV